MLDNNMRHVREDGSSISTSPTFASQEVKQQFLEEQLNMAREVKAGEKIWNDVNLLRQEYGYPDTNVDSIRRGFGQLMEYDAMGWLQKPGATAMPLKEKITTDYEKDTTISEKVIKLTSEELQNEDSLLKAHGYDPKNWDIKSVTNTKIEKTTSYGEGKYYSSRITIKPKKSKLSEIQEITKFFETYKSPIKHSIKKYKERGSQFLVLPLVDIHWGRYCSNEVGEEYNREKARERIIANIENYMKKFASKDFKKIYLIIGQDFFNSAASGYTTSGRHMQDNDGTFKTLFKTGCELLIDIINMLSDLAPVDAIMVEGNHCRDEEYAAGLLLKAYYNNIDYVNIDAQGHFRKYLDLGVTAIGISHGSDEKDRIWSVMQAEEPELWGRTKYHIWLLGHLHHLECEERNGVEVWRLPCTTEPDAWTIKSGFVARSRTMCFIFDEQEGMIENHYINF